MNEQRIVRLVDPLPCAIWSPDGRCGKAAYAAYAWETEPSTRWPTRGLWTLQPVCADCAAAASNQYEQEPA